MLVIITEIPKEQLLGILYYRPPQCEEYCSLQLLFYRLSLTLSPQLSQMSRCRFALFGICLRRSILILRAEASLSSIINETT